MNYKYNLKKDINHMYSRPSLQSHPSGPPNGVIIVRCAYSEALAI